MPMDSSVDFSAFYQKESTYRPAKPEKIKRKMRQAQIKILLLS